MDKYGIIHEKNFGGVYAKISIEDFKGLGFDFGDSFDIEFSNGYRLNDVPFYNGYYTKTNMALICGYQGYPYIDICLNSGDDLWVQADLKDDDYVTISLNEKEKYLVVQQTFNLQYSNNRDDFESDEVFVNFREVIGGNLKEKFIYRGASPVDNEYNRAVIADTLLNKYGIQYDINLSDSLENVKEYQEEVVTPYFNNLLINDKVVLMNMGAGFEKQKFATQLADGIREVLNNQGPYYIHCVEGKDRTGFVVAVILALAKANYQEIVDDYMKTYDCYYGINKHSNLERYLALKASKIDDYLLYLSDCGNIEDITSQKLFEGGKKYLSFGGLSEKEIDDFIDKISKNNI